jgi:hypothetical protein
MDKLQEIQIIGELFFHRFKMADGSFVEVETDEATYRALGMKNPTNPTIDGGVWTNSYAIRKYDTPDGKLAKGQFAIDNGCFFSPDRETREAVELNKDAILAAKMTNK